MQPNNDFKILRYAINFDNKVFYSKKAQYYNYDIATKISSIKNKNFGALWDDHTSQQDRLKFSQQHNREFNYFDDDLSLLNIHSDGRLPVPTISVLKNIKDNDIQSDIINWVSRNRIETAYLKKFRKVFPQIFEITGCKNHSHCYLVINKVTR